MLYTEFLAVREWKGTSSNTMLQILSDMVTEELEVKTNIFNVTHQFWGDINQLYFSDFKKLKIQFQGEKTDLNLRV